MNPILDPNPNRQHAQLWSSSIGELAGSLAPQLPAAGPPPTRLAAALAHLRQRSRAWQEAEHKLRVNELMVGG
jgi:hypothetical protein